jgi:hypothetical protein
MANHIGDANAVRFGTLLKLPDAVHPVVVNTKRPNAFAMPEDAIHAPHTKIGTKASIKSWRISAKRPCRSSKTGPGHQSMNKKEGVSKLIFGDLAPNISFKSRAESIVSCIFDSIHMD